MKKFLAAVMAVCLLALPVQALAADNSQQIGFVQTDNKIDVSVTSMIAAREEISSLQLSLKVVSTGGANVRFTPDSSLSAKIAESRYHAETETLHIYVAGGEALFDKDAPTCRLGSVVVEAEEGAVTVSALEGSLKYVTGTELVAQNKDVSYPEAVNLAFENGAVVPGGNGGSNGGSAGTGNAGGTGSDTGNAGGTGSDMGNAGGTGSGTGEGSSGQAAGGNGQPGSGSAGGSGQPGSGTAGGNGQPGSGTAGGIAQTGGGGAGGAASGLSDTDIPGIDETGLRDALAHAKEYVGVDYTEESFELLREAVKKAEELLDTHGVTQEELDEARLLIENAIGMLKLKDDSPVVSQETPRQEPEEGPEASGENEQETLLEKMPLSWPVIAAIAAGVLVLILAIAVISWRRNRWLDD